jgi:hypothetical protein
MLWRNSRQDIYNVHVPHYQLIDKLAGRWLRATCLSAVGTRHYFIICPFVHSSVRKIHCWWLCMNIGYVCKTGAQIVVVITFVHRWQLCAQNCAIWRKRMQLDSLNSSVCRVITLLHFPPYLTTLLASYVLSGVLSPPAPFPINIPHFRPPIFVSDTWPLKMELTVCHETSVFNQPTLRNYPEDGRIQVNCSGSLRSNLIHCFNGQWDMNTKMYFYTRRRMFNPWLVQKN